MEFAENRGAVGEDRIWGLHSGGLVLQSCVGDVRLVDWNPGRRANLLQFNGSSDVLDDRLPAGSTKERG